MREKIPICTSFPRRTKMQSDFCLKCILWSRQICLSSEPDHEMMDSSSMRSDPLAVPASRLKLGKKHHSSPVASSKSPKTSMYPETDSQSHSLPHRNASKKSSVAKLKSGSIPLEDFKIFQNLMRRGNKCRLCKRTHMNY